MPVLPIRKLLWTVTLVLAALCLCVAGLSAQRFRTIFRTQASELQATSAVLLLKDVRFHVVQIQQFLTDVSATHDDGGYDEASEHRDAALQGLQALQALDARLREPAEAIAKSIGTLDTQGRRMANAYMERGIDAGNAIMKGSGGFDEQSLNLTGQLDALARSLETDMAGARAISAAASHRSRNETLGLMALLLAMLTASLVWVYRGTMAPLHSLGVALDAFRARASDAEVASGMAGFAHAFPEIGASFTGLLAAESARRQQELQSAAANERIRVALDSSGSAVLVVGTDDVVSYANDAAIALLRSLEGAVRQHDARFSAATLVGQRAATLHPQLQSAPRFGELGAPFSAEMQLGPHTIALRANPIVDATGRRQGAVIEWTDRSAELATESEVAQIIEAGRRGNLTRRIDVAGKQGFLGALAQQVNSLLDANQAVLGGVFRMFEALAEGRLDARIEGQFEGDFQRLQANANETAARLADVARQIGATAARIDGSIRELADGNDKLNERTLSQAASLEQTAASMEEMTTQVQSMASNAGQADALVTSAKQLASQGGTIATRAVEAMRELGTSSQRIAAITGLIDELAFQTNLLALNAAVEAARAGEQGRGFAVVAAEVRALAGRSASAAREIRGLIVDSTRRVEDGARLVDETGGALENIAQTVGRAASIVGEIATAGREQALGIEQVSDAVRELDSVTQQNALMVEGATGAIGNLRAQTQALVDAASFFRTETIRPASGTQVRRAAARPAAAA